MDCCLLRVDGAGRHHGGGGDDRSFDDVGDIRREDFCLLGAFTLDVAVGSRFEEDF